MPCFPATRIRTMRFKTCWNKRCVTFDTNRVFVCRSSRLCFFSDAVFDRVYSYNRFGWKRVVPTLYGFSLTSRKYGIIRKETWRDVKPPMSSDLKHNAGRAPRPSLVFGPTLSNRRRRVSNPRRSLQQVFTRFVKTTQDARKRLIFKITPSIHEWAQHVVLCYLPKKKAFPIRAPTDRKRFSRYRTKRLAFAPFTHAADKAVRTPGGYHYDVAVTRYDRVRPRRVVLLLSRNGPRTFPYVSTGEIACWGRGFWNFRATAIVLLVESTVPLLTVVNLAACTRPFPCYLNFIRIKRNKIRSPRRPARSALAIESATN